MLKSLILIVGLCMFPLYFHAQSKLNFIKVDSTTYNAYLNENWNKVIGVSKDAIDNGIDYYYLRMRLGIAYYNQTKYTKSLKHFRSALKYNFDDPVAQQYLYDSYRKLGRSSQAIHLSASFSEKTKKSIKFKKPILNYAEVGGGYIITDNFDKNTIYYTDDNSDTIPGFTILIGDRSAVFGYMDLNITSSISYSLGASLLNVKKRSLFQTFEPILNLDSTVNFDWGYQNYYSVNINPVQYYYDYTIKQNEIYQKLNFQFDHGISIDLFGNLIFVKTRNTLIDIDSTFSNHINYQVTGESPVYFEFVDEKAVFKHFDSTYMDYIVGLDMEKSFDVFTIAAGGSYSSINGADQFQATLKSSYLFNAEGTIYGFSSVTYFDQEREYFDYDPRFIFNQQLGARVFKRVWFTAKFIYGNLNNTNSGNGYYVYNQVDETLFKAGFDLKWYFYNNFVFNLYYNYTKYEGNFSQIKPDSAAEDLPYNYMSNSIIAGIAWKF